MKYLLTSKSLATVWRVCVCVSVDICTAVNLNDVVYGIVNFLDQFNPSKIKEKYQYLDGYIHIDLKRLDDSDEIVWIYGTGKQYTLLGHKQHFPGCILYLTSAASWQIQGLIERINDIIDDLLETLCCNRSFCFLQLIVC